ncbi:MAG: DNA repair protein RecO, partial [Sedimentisphaerales bacterium]|nr:DNA repair protein RecO [Sedimentisphaerales bacterium]
MLIKDMAICIRAVDYSETSQIVTLFAKDNGKLKAIAKGSKRPKSSFDGTIEVLSCGQIVFSGSARQKDSQKLATLTELQQERYFAGLKNSLLNLNCCLFGTELIDNMVQEYDPHPELFDRFLQFVQNESDAQTRREALTLLVLFQLALLRETGLQPVLYACANCKCKVDAAGEKSQWYF